LPTANRNIIVVAVFSNTLVWWAISPFSQNCQHIQ